MLSAARPCHIKPRGRVALERELVERQKDFFVSEIAWIDLFAIFLLYDKVVGHPGNLFLPKGVEEKGEGCTDARDRTWIIYFCIFA